MALIAYEPHIIEDPLMPFFFHISSHLSDKSLYSASNWHDNIEMICCTHGSGEAFLETDVIPFCEGDIVFVNTNVLHRFLPADDVTYHCLIVDRRFFDVNGIELDRYRFIQKFSDERIYSSFSVLAELFADDNAQHRIPRIRSEVLGILITMLEKHLDKDVHEESQSARISVNRIKRAVEYIGANFCRSLGLEEIAAHVGVSKYHFSREFKSLTGMTLVEYINNCRCKYAKQLLEEGSPVAEAAEKSGFENMSYFAKTFKKYIGKVPSETRLRHD